MDFAAPRDELYPLIEPVTSALGHRIVELKSRTRDGRLKISLVLFNPRGLGVNDCAGVYRTVLARIEAALACRDVALEVCSPGLGRSLKTLEEAAVFAGLPVRVLTAAGPTWLSGRLGALGEGALELLPPEGEGEGIKLSPEDIKKIELL
ncbi:MAG: hypothetical protein LBQ61_03425 [Spirochaetales bacterium]|jgi:ribosome maturation factor RimP|nr:hypothetical protein [Spirochaetales bacterium]